MAGNIAKIMKEGNELTSPSVLANLIQTNTIVNQRENVREYQEGLRQTNTSTAITNAEVATENATTAANNANSKAALADTATINANVAADTANTVAIQLSNETLKIFKPSVTNYSELAITYPAPENGWTVTVTSENVSYRYNGIMSEWVNLGYLSSVDTATNETLGIVKGGGNVKIASDGTMNTDIIVTFIKATGTATNIILNDLILSDGISVTFIASYTNGDAKTINGKPWYKPNTTLSPSTTLGKAYTVWYDILGDCFFIKASASGNAIAEHVLAPYIFSNGDDTDIVGTMADNSTITDQTLETNNAEYMIPKGYHNGLHKVKAVISGLVAGVIKAGSTVGGIFGTFTADATAIAAQMLAGVTAYVNGNKVTGTIPSKAAQTYYPSTSTQTIASGQYLSETQTIAATTGTATPDKVLSGYTFDSAAGIGLTGTAIQGKKFASGQVAASDTAYCAYADGSSGRWLARAIVSGLSFKPSIITLRYIEGTYEYMSVYGTSPMYGENCHVYIANGSEFTYSPSNIRVGTNDVIVYNGGFNLPLPSGGTYTWIAYE